jgi:hypothetical protein
MTQEKFEVYAIVELFGHNKIAGKVTEQVIGGSSFIRVDVPNTKDVPGFTRLLHANAIYAINPVTEEVANGYAERIQSQPIQSWDAREVLKRIDEQKKLNEPPKYDQEYEDNQRKADNELLEDEDDLNDYGDIHSDNNDEKPLPW